LEEKEGGSITLELNSRREVVGTEGVKNWVRIMSSGWLWHCQC
jgi:hypothetical protein